MSIRTCFLRFIRLQKNAESTWRAIFTFFCKPYRDKIITRQQNLAKQPVNYENAQQKNCKFEQKPIKNFDDFSDGEEEDFKILARKQNEQRREQKEASKAKNLKIKEEENKANKSQMWDRLNELNSQFKTIKQAKRELEKMSATIL